MKKEVKILYLLLTLLWANVFVWFICIMFSNNVEKTNKTVKEYKKVLNRKNIEDLVELTKDTGNLNYINNECLGCEN